MYHWKEYHNSSQCTLLGCTDIQFHYPITGGGNLDHFFKVVCTKLVVCKGFFFVTNTHFVERYFETLLSHFSPDFQNSWFPLLFSVLYSITIIFNPHLPTSDPHLPSNSCSSCFCVLLMFSSFLEHLSAFWPDKIFQAYPIFFLLLSWN